MFQQFFNNKYYSHMTDSTVNWRLAQRNCANLNVETDLCQDGETTGQFSLTKAKDHNLSAKLELVN